MSKFKAGPWASERDYTRMRVARRFAYDGEDDSRRDGVMISAQDAALRCMELVPVLVEALEKAEASLGTSMEGLPVCRYCGGDYEDRILHNSWCMIGEALKMARGEK